MKTLILSLLLMTWATTGIAKITDLKAGQGVRYGQFSVYCASPKPVADRDSRPCFLHKMKNGKVGIVYSDNDVKVTKNDWNIIYFLKDAYQQRKCDDFLHSLT